MRAPVHDLHVSNLLTYVSLAAGVSSVGVVFDGRSVALAGAALAVAAAADTCDGRFARLFARTGRQARIGHELDSLVDAVAFGLAPVVVLSASRMPGPAMGAVVWWVAAVFYVLAVVTRLSFYNVEGDDTRFIGVPAPAAALLCVTSLLVSVPSWAAPWPLVVGGALMIAPVSFPRPKGMALSAFVAWAVALFIALSAKAFG